MTDVEVLVLGPVVLRHAGQVHSPSSHATRALLARLALGGRSGVGDAELAAGRSIAALRVAVYRLRTWLRMVADDAVTVRRTGTGYRLDCGADLDRFRALVAAATGAPAPAERRRLLGDALAVWRGDPLGDLPAEACPERIVAQLDRERAAAATGYARELLAVGEPGSTLRVLAPLIERHLLDEPLQAAWIEALAAAGRQAEALAGYDRVRRTLHDELGVEPGPQLRDTLLRILRQDLVSTAGDRLRPPAGTRSA